MTNANTVMLRLIRIFKSSLYAVVYLAYTFVIGAIFAVGDWRLGLLGLFVIAGMHPLRYLWESSITALDNINPDDESYDTVVKYQKTLMAVLASSVFVCDMITVGVVYFAMTPAWWALGVMVTLVIVELLHLKIRALSRDESKIRQEEKPETPPVKTVAKYPI